jgi:hypothetical protein
MRIEMESNHSLVINLVIQYNMGGFGIIAKLMGLEKCGGYDYMLKMSGI